MKDNMMYSDFVLKHMPQLLTQVNRDVDTKTYGSCDRNYWHYNIRDFSSAILQQACLSLALVYKLYFPGNIYYGNENVREWAVASLRYMGKIQLRDGSFNEYYPNEHAFPPTAFNLFAGCRTYRLLALEDNSILCILGKAAEWLCNHHEKDACNQEWAAIAGLYQYYLITKERIILDAVQKKIRGIMQLFSQEGWFPEQGGVDIGYASVTLDMLTEYYVASKDETVKPTIVSMVDFLSHFVHPDGTAGGEYGSRNTTYFLPAGLETCVLLHLNDDTARAMLQQLFTENSAGSFMDAIDDRYMSHYVMHSYLRALEKFVPRPVTGITLPFCTIHKRYFAESGLLTVFNGEYYAVAGLQKGGVIKVWQGTKEVLCNCGYRILLDERKIAATNWLDPEYEVHVNNNICIIRGRFSLVKLRTQNPVYLFLIRAAALIRGGKLHNDIKRMTILQQDHCKARFERKIIFANDRVQIEDKICNPTGRAVRKAPNVSLRLVASAKFFSRNDLLNPPLTDYGSRSKLKICRTVYVRDGNVTENVLD